MLWFGDDQFYAHFTLSQFQLWNIYGYNGFFLDFDADAPVLSTD